MISVANEGLISELSDIFVKINYASTSHLKRANPLKSGLVLSKTILLMRVWVNFFSESKPIFRAWFS